MRRKYGNVKTGGYDSRKEAKRGGELDLLETLGEITDLKKQVRFEVIPKQVDAAGKCIERAMHYVADFTFIDKDGVFHCIDVKGFRTPEYKIKRKLLLYLHKIRIEEE